MMFLSSSCVRARTIKECITILVESGVRKIELSGGTRHYPGLEHDVLELKSRCGLEYLVHNYFPPPSESAFVLNIASGNSAARARSIDFAERAIDLASRIGSSMYTIHAGYLVNYVPGDNPEVFTNDAGPRETPESAIRNLENAARSLCAYASEREVRFGVENLFPEDDGTNNSVLCTEPEIDRFFSLFSRGTGPGLLLDLGHAKIAGNLLGFDAPQFVEDIVESYEERLLMIHVSYNDGVSDQHLLPPRNSWMFSVMRSIHRAGRIPLSIEARNEPLDRVVEFVKALD